MIKNIGVISICLALTACTGNSVEQSQTSTEETKAMPQQAVIKVGFIASSTGNIPLNFVDEKGKFQGFEYDILQEVAKRTNYHFDYEYKPREALFDDLNNKKYQILSGNISINEERTSQYAMTNPYLDGYPVTLLSKDASLKTLADLKDKSISLKDSPMESSYAIINAEKAEDKDNVFYVGSDWLAVKNVLADKSVSAIGNSSVMPYFVEKYSDRNTPLYFSIDYNYPEEHYGFLLHKDDTDLLEGINTALADMKSDGTYQSIFKKWF